MKLKVSSCISNGSRNRNNSGDGGSFLFLNQALIINWGS